MIPDATRLRHILDAADKVLSYAARNRQDDMTLDAVVRQLAVIGEAVRHLSPELRKKHEHVPWKSIVGLRNLVIHEYYIVNNERIWRIADHDIPALRPHIIFILNQLLKS